MTALASFGDLGVAVATAFAGYGSKDDRDLVRPRLEGGRPTLFLEEGVPRQVFETSQAWSGSFRRAARIQQRERLALERLAYAREALGQCVEFDPDRYGGAPVLAGTRFPVSQVLAELAEGASIGDLAEDMSLDRAKLSQVLSILSAFLDRPRR
jgi:uncharacterized protein (DUF433 family)